MNHPLLPIYQAVDNGIARSMKTNNAEVGRPPSCKVRCTGCCEMLVTVTLVEALYIAETAAAYPARKKAFQKVLQKCAEQVPLLDADHMDHEVWRKTKSPCPLLEDGKCSAYNERPVACRAFFSYSDPALCHVPGAKIVQTSVTPFAKFFDEQTTNVIDKLPNFHGPLPAMLLLAADLVQSCPEETPRQVMARHGGNATGIMVRWMHLRRDLETYPAFYASFESMEKTGYVPEAIRARIVPYSPDYYVGDQCDKTREPTGAEMASGTVQP